MGKILVLFIHQLIQAEVMFSGALSGVQTLAFCIFHFCSCPVSSVQLIWICKPCWHALIWLGQLNFCTMIRLGGYLPTSVSKDYKLVLVCDVNDCLNKGRAGGSEYLSHCITLLCRLIREETSPTLDERELTGRMT